MCGVLSAGAWALLASSSLVIGAWFGATFKVPRSVVGDAMGFGAGALVSAVAYELIPRSRVSDLDTWLSFGAGAVVFFTIDGILERRSGHSAGRAIALGALLDGIPESIVLGISIAVGGAVSVGFLAAVFVSNIPEALSSTSELQSEMSTRSIFRLWIGIAVVSAIAGALGYAFAEALPTSDGRRVQAFAAGAVLTMLASSMMPEAFSQGGRRVALFTALGFAVAAVLTTFD
jgi:ZIP family zinc transporter